MSNRSNRDHHLGYRAMALLALIAMLTVVSARLRADTGTCGGAAVTLPFTDVPASNIFFCAIAEAYFSGLTNGTSATTYSPAANVPREQMAAFVSRTLDQSLKRGSRRAALNQFWTPQGDDVPTTTVGNTPRLVACDGADLWVASSDNKVSRVRASDGRLLETWTNALGARGVLVARGRIYVTGRTIPGRLYSLDPTQPAGAATLVTDQLEDGPEGIAFDGTRIWTAHDGSVSIVTFSTFPLCTPCITNVAGFGNLSGILYDGSHIWVTDQGDQSLKKLDSSGNPIPPRIQVGGLPGVPVFDGTNIWVPSAFDSVTVVRVKDSQGNPLSTPFVLATLTGNGLDRPTAAAFDGQRVLVTNFDGNSVSLWKAADLTPLGSFSLLLSPLSPPVSPFGACSDGVNFWVTLQDADRLARF